MKVKSLRCILFLFVMLFCMVAVGCNNAKEDYGQVTAISIFEHGGEDGRLIDWKLYQNDNKNMLSYIDHREKEAKPKIFEITEQEYNDIMSLDYEKYISEYNATSKEVIFDEILYRSTITYENGAEKSTEADMAYATNKLYELLVKYGN